MHNPHGFGIKKKKIYLKRWKAKLEEKKKYAKGEEREKIRREWDRMNQEIIKYKRLKQPVSAPSVLSISESITRPGTSNDYYKSALSAIGDSQRTSRTLKEKVHLSKERKVEEEKEKNGEKKKRNEKEEFKPPEPKHKPSKPIHKPPEPKHKLPEPEHKS
ncbi:hypothetical protein ADUPG1_005604, partial [Aduncisulcus paluster]